MRALRHRQRRVLLAKLLERRLAGRRQVAAGPAADLGEVERVLGALYQAAGLAADAATATFLLLGGAAEAGGAAISAPLLTAGSLGRWS